MISAVYGPILMKKKAIVYFSSLQIILAQKTTLQIFKWVKTHFFAYSGHFSSKMTHLTCIMVLFYRAQFFSLSILMIFLFFGPQIEAFVQKLRRFEN